MNDRRFVSTLNEVATAMGTDLLHGLATAKDADAVGLWAEFLRRCVERGVSVGDPRWRSLEVQRVAGRPRFALPGGAEHPRPDGSADFSVGLTLLMAVLGREDAD